MYPEVAPRMMPRIAKWILREVNIVTSCLCVFVLLCASNQEGTKAQRHKGTIGLIFLLGFRRVRLGFGICSSFFFCDRFVALVAGRRSGFGSFDQLLRCIGIRS